MKSIRNLFYAYSVLIFAYLLVIPVTMLIIVLKLLQDDRFIDVHIFYTEWLQSKINELEKLNETNRI